MSKKKKRQYTKTVFLRRHLGGTSVMTGVILRKNYGRRFDVVQLCIQSFNAKKPIVLNMTPAEAIEISVAISSAACEFFETFEPYRNWEKRQHKK